MKALWTLIKWDLLLLHRNQLFLISVVITVLYIGVFHLLQPLGDLSALLILLIFNDPVLTGFMFGGILWLFDKNQHTLQAISVLPLPLHQYLLSKAVVLSVLATFLAFMMVVATKGWAIHWLPLTAGVFFSAFLFSFMGFAIGALARNFNYFLLYAIPLLILNALPFLGTFGLINPVFGWWIPSFGGIELLHAAFHEQHFPHDLLLYLHILIWSYTCYRIGLATTQRRLL